MASSGNGTALSSAVAPGRCLLIRRLVTAAYWLGNGYQTYPPSVHPTGREHQAWRAYRSYRFDWQPTQVTYSMDLEDGQGFRTLWTLSGAADTVIPSHPAPCFMNLWHNANHWLNDRPARPPRRPVSFRVDRVSIP